MARRWCIALLLSLHALLLGWIGWATFPNKTEVGHIGAAVYFWHTLRFDVFCVNPPLTRIVSGLPVLLCDPKYDWNFYSSRPQDRSEWAMGRAFIAANSPEKIRWCFVLARWSLIPFLLLGGYFGYRLSREIYGNSAGFLFLTLWSFSPLMLGVGATICPDAAAAALGLVGIYSFRQWLHKPDWTRSAIAGVCLGLLPLSKLTWIIAFGLWPLIWCLWTIPIYLTKAEKRSLKAPSFRQLMVILFLGLYTLNMGYLFDGTCRPLGEYVFISQSLRGQEVSENQRTPAVENRFAGTWFGAIPVPLPADFVQGIDTQRHDFERGLPSYLRGQWADHGWWYFYLYVLAVKMPLGTWCLVALAVGVTMFDLWMKKPSPPAPLPQGEGRLFSASWRDEMVLLAPFLAIFILVSSQTGFSIHSRYVIPALPFLFVLTSKVARVFEMRPLTKKRIVMAAAVVLALLGSVGGSLAIYPHSLSYFNELVGGPKGGPKHLLDSNIDWGQDLFYLKDWLEEHPEAKLDGLAYWGSYPTNMAGIAEIPRPPADPLSGWYALSVNEIFAQSKQYCHFQRFKPVAMAGYSIYIYHLTLDEVNPVRRELGLEELPEFDSDSNKMY